VRRTLYTNCPNAECAYHAKAPTRWYWNKGTFTTKWNHQPVPRTFSSHTFRPTYCQKKPYLNEPIRQHLAESGPIRGVARALKTSKTTVLRKLKFLGLLSKQVCEAEFAKPENKTSYVQFDEMETSERSACLPLTLAFAVRPKNGHIVAARVGRIPPHALRKTSLKRFGLRESQKEATVRAMLRDLKKVVRDEKNFHIESDSWISYPFWIKDELPFAKHTRFIGEETQTKEKAMSRVDDPGELVDFADSQETSGYWIKTQKNGKRVIRAFDPLFAINQKCGLLRSRLSRLRRRFWGYTQKIEFLEYHLWLFIALNNGYELPV
jgi:hypothetical protein